MHTVLTNPIYNGWRVYDKKRDMSPGARRCTPNGRQGDRRKVARDPDEVIRVKVIDPPLVSDADFRRVQEIIAVKTRRHWKHSAKRIGHFTYSGFLICSECESPVYGKFASDFYYFCRYRPIARKSDGFRCSAAYMRRERLETKLDGMFETKFTDRAFITDLLRDVEAKSEAVSARERIVRLELEIRKLREKRERILDSYFEGLLTRAERDQRLLDVDTRRRMTEEMLLREAPAPSITVRSLMTAFAPLFEWQYLNRENKRRILAVTVPEIHVANYSVRGVAVSLAARFFRGDYVTPTHAASVITTPPPDRIFIPLNL